MSFLSRSAAWHWHSHVLLTSSVDGILFSTWEYGTGCLLIGTSASSPWSWFLLFFFLVSSYLWVTGIKYQWVHWQHVVSISRVSVPSPTLRCSPWGSEVLGASAHAGCQCEPDCVRPRPHEAVQIPEEPLHLRLLPLPLAVCVISFFQNNRIMSLGLQILKQMSNTHNSISEFLSLSLSYLPFLIFSRPVNSSQYHASGCHLAKPGCCHLGDYSRSPGANGQCCQSIQAAPRRQPDA